MKDAMGIILCEGKRLHINELTEFRAPSALPMYGRYRLIDFALSNLVNSGVINVGVTTMHNYSSLMDHLGSGKEWDLSRKNYGLFILPPNNRWDISIDEGSIDVLKSIEGYIRKSRQKYVVISDGHTVCNTTYNEALSRHVETGADITMLYYDSETDAKSELVLDMDDTGRVVLLENRPARPASVHVSLGTYIIEKSLLESLVDQCYSRGRHDFVMDILVENVKSLKIFGCPVTGFVRKVTSLKSYYNANMDVLNENVRRELFGSKNAIYTKIKDQVPSRYGPEAKARDSFIADGCVIAGNVSGSVLFRGVHVGKNVEIKNSIIMQNTFIQEGAQIENVVIDKECIIRQGKRLIGQQNYPVVVAKKTVI